MFGSVRNLQHTKLLAATNAMRADATLRWTPTGGVPVAIRLRRQQPPRITGGRAKSFQLAMVSAESRVYAEQVKYGVTAAVATRRNLVTNPNFEAGVTGWSVYGAGGITLSQDATQKLDGAAGMKVLNAGSGAGRGVTSDAFVVNAGTKYTGSLYVKGQAGVQMQLYLAEYQSDGVTFIALGSTTFTATGAWQRISGTYTTTTGVRMRLVLVTVAATANTAYMDQVLLERADTLDSYFPTVAQLAAGDAGWTGSANASASYLNVFAGGAPTFMSSFTSPLTAQSGEYGLVRVTNQGNTDSPPTLRLRGPMKNPIITHKTSGKELRLSITLNTGDTLDLDTRNHTIIANGDINRYSALDFVQSNWWSLEPGVNDVKLSATDFSTDSSLTVYWNDAFL